MKIACSGLLLFLVAACTVAQTSSSWPDVTVVESKWRVEVHNPALDKDPLSATRERQAEEQAQKSAAIESDNRVKQGQPALPPVARQPPMENGNSQITLAYVYELRVTNNGRKEIRQIAWDYVFFEPGTTHEVGRRQFVSEVTLKPGAGRHLIMPSRLSPTGTIVAAKAGSKTSDLYSEQVLIRNILYADGSSWSAPQVKEDPRLPAPPPSQVR